MLMHELALNLIGPIYECYILIEVIKADELNEGNLSAAAGKQDK